MQLIRRRFLLTLLAASVCGCSLGESVIQREQHSPRETVQKPLSATAFFIDPHARELQVSDLQAGQQVQLIASSQTKYELTEINFSCTQVAGTVVSIDDERVVLCKAVTMTQASRMTGAPVVNKVPYVSRLFKNTGIGRECVAIPGEISIPRSEIVLAGELSSSGVESLIQAQQFERIGIDFDFAED